MKMPPAVTPLVALSVRAMLALREMESTVQVRLVIFSWLKSNVTMLIQIHLRALLYVNTVQYYVFVVVSGVSWLKTTIDSFNRH